MTSTTNKSVIGIKFPYQQITLTQISNQAMYCLIQLVYSYFQPYLYFLSSVFANRFISIVYVLNGRKVIT